MEKIVTSGMRDCTINLDGSECAVKFGADYRTFAVRNNGDADIIVSIEQGKTAEDDGVRIIHSGESGMLSHMRSDVDTVYITGSGNVEVNANNTSENPFKNGGKGGESGGSWITAEGNPITMTGLQGDVPFNSISIINGQGTEAKDRISPNGISNFYKIDNSGAVRDSSGTRLLKYNVTAGTQIYVKTITTETNKFCFYRDSVGASGVVGKPVSDVADGIVTVPSGANIVAIVGNYSDDDISGMYNFGAKELTLTISGKNLIGWPYTNDSYSHGTFDSPITSDGVTFTPHENGLIEIDGINSKSSNLNVHIMENMHFRKGVTYTLSGYDDYQTEDNGRIRLRVTANLSTGNETVMEDSNKPDNNKTWTAPEDCTGFAYISIASGVGGHRTFNPQLEYGDKITGYEKPKPITEYTITPDSDNYDVPMDITQLDGTNVIMADNADAVISVNANKANPQLAKVYDIAGLHLLFEGETSAEAPAVLDLTPYRAILVNSSNVMETGKDYVVTRLIETDRIAAAIAENRRFISSAGGTGTLELYVSGTVGECRIYDNKPTSPYKAYIYGIK